MKLLPNTSLIKQHGYLALLAVLFIAIIGFLGTTIVYLYSESIAAANQFQQAEATLYIADSGFEKAARFLLTPNLTGSNARIACASLSGNTNLTNTSFSNGTFTATATSGSPVYAQTTLSSAISNSATTIPVTSTTGFVPAGRITIDYEIINYGGISGNNFIGIQRGVNKSYNTAHAVSAPVAQYECLVDVKAGMPNLTSPLYQREIQQAVPLQEGWAVGTNSNGAFSLTHWNRPTETAWTSSPISNGNATTLNSVAMLSNAEGWAVGASGTLGTNFVFLHWLNSAWNVSTVAAPCSGQTLTGVSAVSSQEAWAVGTRIPTILCLLLPYRYTVLHWNGTSWSLLSPTSTPSIPIDSLSNQNLNAVAVIGTNGNSVGNLGFAVGNGGVILQYNGTNWTSAASPTSQNLNAVYIVSASEAWAVGTNGTIIKWNGSTWSAVTSPTTATLNGIAMLDATLSGTAQTGWAVGNSGVAITYNGSSWSSQNTGSANNLYDVALFFTPSSQDVWAVGDAGTIMHWNGSAWTSVASGLTQALQSISLIAPQQFPFAWQEVFP